MTGDASGHGHDHDGVEMDCCVGVRAGRDDGGLRGIGGLRLRLPALRAAA